MKEKDSLEMALDSVDWVLVVTINSLVCVFSYTGIGFFSLLPIDSVNKIINLSTNLLSVWKNMVCMCVYISANSSTANTDSDSLRLCLSSSFSLSLSLTLCTCGTSHWRDKRHIQCHTLRFNRRYSRLAAAAAVASVVADVCFLRCGSQWIRPKNAFFLSSFNTFLIDSVARVSYHRGPLSLTLCAVSIHLLRLSM